MTQKYTHGIILDAEEGFAEVRHDYSFLTHSNPYIEIFVAAMTALHYSEKAVIKLMQDYIDEYTEVE